MVTIRESLWKSPKQHMAREPLAANSETACLVGHNGVTLLSLPEIRPRSFLSNRKLDILTGQELQSPAMFPKRHHQKKQTTQHQQPQDNAQKGPPFCSIAQPKKETTTNRRFSRPKKRDPPFQGPKKKNAGFHAREKKKKRAFSGAQPKKCIEQPRHWC